MTKCSECGCILPKPTMTDCIIGYQDCPECLIGDCINEFERREALDAFVAQTEKLAVLEEKINVISSLIRRNIR